MVDFSKPASTLRSTLNILCCLFFAIPFIAMIPYSPKKKVFTSLSFGTPGTALNIGASDVSTLVDGDTLLINPGSYQVGTISGIHKAIHIYAAPGTVIINANNGANVYEINTSSRFLLENWQFKNGTYRGLHLDGNVDSLTIRCSFRNYRDYVIIADGLTYAGTQATRNDGMEYQITSDSNSNSPVLHLANMQYNCNIHNCIIDSVIGTTNQMFEFLGYNVTVAFCTFTNINIGGTSHNSIIYAAGKWSIHNNTRVNFQGEDRLRSYTIDSSATNPRDTSLYYDNFAFNSVKYGGAEIQQLPADTNTNTGIPNIKCGEYYISNCTAGRLRNLDFPGGGSEFTLEQTYSHNNRLYNSFVVFPQTDIADTSTLNSVTKTVINDEAGVISKFDTARNTWSNTWTGGGLADSTIGLLTKYSKLINAGNTQTLFSTDIIGVVRPKLGAWDIGAAEFNFREYFIFTKPFSTKQLN